MKYCCSRISQKWVFAVMGFCAVACTYAMRLCLPLTISKMVTPIKHTNKIHDETCPSPNITISVLPTHNSSSVILNYDTYDWSEPMQGIILGSFYWGYILSHISGGMLAERFGGKHTLGFGIAATAVCTILTPLSIVWGGGMGLVWLRIFMGLCEGITHPAISVMLAQWVPAEERSKISTLVYTGANFGILVVSVGLGSMLRLMNWPGVYYLFGGIGLLWYLLWLVLCYNNPREHPFISEKEAKELNEKLREYTHDDAPPVPWRHLVTSAPFWALVVAFIGRDWAGYTFMSDMPKYTMNVLKFTVDENGVLYLLIHIVVIVMSLFFSWLADWLIVRDYMSRTNVRKLMTTISLGINAGFIITSSYIGCNKLMYVVTSCFIMLTSAAGFPGLKANVLDLSPNYAGTVAAISHGLAGLCGIGSPYVVGLLAPHQSLSEWRSVYWIITTVLVTTNIIYLIFGSGDVQKWNNPNFDRKQKGNKDVEMTQITKLLTADKM